MHLMMYAGNMHVVFAAVCRSCRFLPPLIHRLASVASPGFRMGSSDSDVFSAGGKMLIHFCKCLLPPDKVQLEVCHVTFRPFIP